MDMYERNGVTKAREKVSLSKHPDWENKSLEEKGYNPIGVHKPKIGDTCRVIYNPDLSRNGFAIEVFERHKFLAVVFSNSYLECCEDLSLLL